MTLPPLLVLMACVAVPVTYLAYDSWTIYIRTQATRKIRYNFRKYTELMNSHGIRFSECRLNDKNDKLHQLSYEFGNGKIHVRLSSTEALKFLESTKSSGAPNLELLVYSLNHTK